MDNKQVVTRFAPSPTGHLHIGSLRSALFNWLWAKKNNGTFILRVEDTDQARLVEGAVDQIKDSLHWLGIDYDFGPDKPNGNGPYQQSDRLEIYAEHILTLLDKGLAYRDWNNSEVLANLRQEAQAAKKPFIYKKSMAKLDGDLSEPHVIRIEIAADQELSWNDIVKGPQKWSSNDVDDFVALKGDGYPTYQFANVVDDHLMEITHVIRADEWLSSTPKHIALYDMFGWERPIFVHVAPVLGADGSKKLSKRDGAQNAQDYAKQGYLPVAVANYLALLGWNPKTEQEIFSFAELIDSFSLEGLQTSGSRFDQTRLDWMNGKHIRLMSIEALDKSLVDGGFWSEVALASSPPDRQNILKLVHERLKKLEDINLYTNFFFNKPEPIANSVILKETKFDLAQAETILKETITAVDECDFTEAALELTLYDYAKSHDLKVGKYFMFIRLIVTGSPVAPGLFETLHQLGEEEVLERLRNYSLST